MKGKDSNRLLLIAAGAVAAWLLLRPRETPAGVDAQGQGAVSGQSTLVVAPPPPGYTLDVGDDGLGCSGCSGNVTGGRGSRGGAQSAPLIGREITLPTIDPNDPAHDVIYRGQPVAGSVDIADFEDAGGDLFAARLRGVGSIGVA